MMFSRNITNTQLVSHSLLITACTAEQAVVHKPCAKSLGEGNFRPPPPALQLRDPWTDFHETWNI